VADGDQSVGQEQGKRRKFITTVKESAKTAPELAEIIESRYQPISNKKTLEAADQVIEQSPDKADELVFNTAEPPSALSNAIAQRLIGKAQEEKNWTRAKAIVEVTAERNTKLGQTIQALSMYNRLTPEGLVQYARKVIDQAKKGIKQKQRLTNFEKMAKQLEDDGARAKLAKKLGIPYLSEELIADLKGRMEKIQGMKDGRAKDIETALMIKQLQNQIPVSLGKKLAFIQTLAQLLNPKTMIRNILGNAIFQGAELVSDSIGTALDIAVSFHTGKRTQALPSLKTQLVGLIEEGKKSSEEVMLGINLKEQPTKFDIPQNGVFHNKFGQWFEKLLSFGLRVPDRASYGAAYADELRKEMLLYKKNTGQSLEEPSLEMIERAHLTGLYRTYQDDNTLSRGFVSLKKFLNAGRDFGLGDMIIKYPRTPSNLLARGIEYSPLGFVKTIKDLAMPLAGYEFNPGKFVRDTQRALTGSAFLVGTGWILGSLGIISGKGDRDKDVREQLSEVGIRQYQINVSALKRFAMSGMDPSAAKMEKGDILVSYDWMQPLSISLALGANMAINPRENVADKVINLVDRIAEASETLTEQPLVRGIRVVTRRENPIEGIAQVIKDIPASFVPTLLNQVRQLTNNTYRNVRDPNYLKETYNRAIYRIPGLSGTLPERISPRGKPMSMYQNETNNPFNVFMNPAFVNTYQPDDTAQMVLDIWENSGEAIHFPRVAPATVKLSGQKDRLILRPDEYHDYQAYIGRKTDILFGKLQKDRKFMGLPPEEQGKRLQRYLTDINSAAKIELFGNRPSRVSANVIDIIRKIKIDMTNIETIEERRAEEAGDEEGFTPGGFTTP
jgi:ribosomal protein L7/L12